MIDKKRLVHNSDSITELVSKECMINYLEKSRKHLLILMPPHQSSKTMSNNTLSLENLIKEMMKLKCLKSDYHPTDQMHSKRTIWVVIKTGNQSCSKTHFSIQDNSLVPCIRRVISRQVKQSRIRKSLEDP